VHKEKSPKEMHPGFLVFAAQKFPRSEAILAASATKPAPKIFVQAVKCVRGDLVSRLVLPKKPG
jgi:hypothetical protein